MNEQAKYTPGRLSLEGTPGLRRAGGDMETVNSAAALIDELLGALEAYRAARAMPSVGDYAAIPWESKAGNYNPTFGGGDCEEHGRWYGRCYCCEGKWRSLCAQADRDAVHARDNALRAADERARTVIAKARGEQQ